MRAGTGSRSRQGRLRFVAAGCFLLSCASILLPTYPAFRAVFLDVGQGDCILLQTRQHSFLIDCGSSSVENVWERRVEGCLKYFGVRRLDGILLSHGDLDHICGITRLLEESQWTFFGRTGGGIGIGGIYLPEEQADAGDQTDKGLEALQTLAREKGVSIGRIRAGEKLADGALSLTCLYPSRETMISAGNARSMVLLAQFRNLQILLTGDLEKEGEQTFLDGFASADFPASGYRILKAGHHGSANATSTRFLEAFRPDLAVISCGKNNGYGHPAPQVLERLAMAGCEVLRTDEDGAVVVEVKGGSLWLGTGSGS